MRKQTVERDDPADAETTIERAFEFVRDVLDDPAVLDELPERATLTITPIERQDSHARYTATTRRFAIAAVQRLVAIRHPPHGPERLLCRLRIGEQCLTVLGLVRCA